MSRAHRGRGWEAKLDHQHRTYRKEGRAVVFHAHPRVTVHNGRAIREKGPPDYFAAAAGQAVLFDAKDHKGTRWPFAKLAPHQAIDLERWQENGGIAGIVLRLERRAWWVDWRALGPLWWTWKESGPRKAQASVDVAWLDTVAMPMRGTDWLTALEEAF